jgi:light-regulated signal transduction histidine kinase (bacteriophytochrome)
LLLDIIDTVREPLIVLDAAFRVVHANRSFFGTFQLEPLAVVGKELFALGDGQWDIPPLRELLQDKLAVQPHLSDVDLEHVFPGIGRKVMLLNARLVSQGAELPRIILLAIEDVTVRRLAERRALERRTELQRSNLALDEFASVASHDLQEPLRKILTFGDRLMQSAGPTLTSESQRELDRMLGAAARMRVLINDILRFAQVSARADAFTSTDLARAAHDAVSELESRVLEAGATIRIGALPSIDADALQMRQLLQNLIGNAIKYRHATRPLVVRVDSTGSDAVQTIITVSDNGIGFGDQHAERIFKMFERLHGREKYEGSGIGLAICRRIIERHHGTIIGTGAAGEGATFTVTLPTRHALAGYPS